MNRNERIFWITKKAAIELCNPRPNTSAMYDFTSNAAESAFDNYLNRWKDLSINQLIKERDSAIIQHEKYCHKGDAGAAADSIAKHQAVIYFLAKRLDDELCDSNSTSPRIN